jgi:hypothetical protein
MTAHVFDYLAGTLGGPSLRTSRPGTSHWLAVLPRNTDLVS